MTAPSVSTRAYPRHVSFCWTGLLFKVTCSVDTLYTFNNECTSGTEGQVNFQKRHILPRSNLLLYPAVWLKLCLIWHTDCTILVFAIIIHLLRSLFVDHQWCILLYIVPFGYQYSLYDAFLWSTDYILKERNKKIFIMISCNLNDFKRPVSHSARRERPARERHKIRIRIMGKCRQPSAAQYKSYTLARFSLLLNVDITILYPNIQTLTVYM